MVFERGEVYPDGVLEYAQEAGYISAKQLNSKLPDIIENKFLLEHKKTPGKELHMWMFHHRDEYDIEYFYLQSGKQRWVYYLLDHNLEKLINHLAINHPHIIFK